MYVVGIQANYIYSFLFLNLVHLFDGVNKIILYVESKFINYLLFRYVPWNLHEPSPGVFNFEGIVNIRYSKYSMLFEPGRVSNDRNTLCSCCCYATMVASWIYTGCVTNGKTLIATLLVPLNQNNSETTSMCFYNSNNNQYDDTKGKMITIKEREQTVVG